VIVFLLLIVVLLIGLTAAAVMGRMTGFMADPTSSHSFPGLPSGSWRSQDIRDLRFDQGLRGYRMDQVDDVLDALSARLLELEVEVASLHPATSPDPAEGVVHPLTPDGSDPLGDGGHTLHGRHDTPQS